MDGTLNVLCPRVPLNQKDEVQPYMHGTWDQLHVWAELNTELGMCTSFFYLVLPKVGLQSKTITA